MRVLVFIAQAVVIPQLFGCDKTSPAPSAAIATPSAAVVWVAPERPSRESADEVPGRVLATADSEAVVAAPLAARVVSVLVKPGDTVTQGQAMAVVVMPELDAAVAAARAATSSLAVLRKRRQNLATLEAENLVRGGDIAALEVEIARLEGERLRAQAVLASAQLQTPGRNELRAPIAGVVVEARGVVGEFRAPDSPPLFRVRARAGSRVEATLLTAPTPNATFSYVVAEQRIPLTLENLVPSTTGAGFNAWFSATAQGEIPAGALGRVAITESQEPDVWVVPEPAIARDGDSVFVFTKRNGTVERTSVTVIRVVRARAVVRGALDDAVVAQDAAASKLVAAPAKRAP